jgi:hypothetical protein
VKRWPLDKIPQLRAQFLVLQTLIESPQMKMAASGGDEQQERQKTRPF